MYGHVQPLIKYQNNDYFDTLYQETRTLLFNLLDSPVKYTQHIGGTRHFNYDTEPILDILIGVDNLHDITALDEKRLNYAGFYRLHHSYKKEVMMAKFNNLKDLKQEVRLHIIQLDTPLFEQYQKVDELLSHHKKIANQFATKKEKLLHHIDTIRQYENQKQTIFENIYKQYGHNT
ncbi:GrpB family protein [Staphylococcus warneri]|jgi:GrpB-like predicted nucleotidyltransferase (UPF0157 family)|uniref:GrpB family protein n=1 Tax=Staphylococcus warneri TaxID=1292 RepID=UPI0001A5C584|nr:GrpB family protein [Staphylococcus warneri]EEQ80498.1 hypothetical protein STAWA0001_1276 [Staphylococcus warneri L37603]MCJ1803207.1 GrpB family protein [Staphylococcus warneri]QKI08261.1 GrpB family protein [Staphylococcus warneri]